MKLKNLDLSNLTHFIDVYFDFTYPSGHPKAGKPLDKICIIGQSGTGKTTILNSIKSFFFPTTINLDNFYSASFVNDITSSNVDIHIGIDISVYHNLKEDLYVDLRDIGSFFKNKDDNKLISLPADFQILSKYKDVSNPPNEYVYDFGELRVQDIWKLIIESIKELRSKEVVIRQQISNVAERQNLNADEIFTLMQPLLENLRAIQNSENNPLKKLAKECLDPILNQFSLKVNTESKIIENFENLGFIEICNMYGDIVREDILSTGTKQVIFSSLPFYILNPENFVILIDEPERSLYPNIQKILVDHYSKFTKNCQFIYATHSPIVASCFDPWEVFELKFNNEGNVYIEKYYEGDRHVDNYKIHPKYLTYELILKEVFDVKNTDGEDRARQLTELIMLEEKLKQFKRDGDNTSIEFNITMEDYQRIGKLLSWPVKFD